MDRKYRFAVWGAIGVLVALARWRFAILTDGLVPYVDYDTQIFRQVGELPFGLDLLGSSKPLLVPLLYRAATGDPAIVVAVQTNLAFLAWTLCTASLALAVRRRGARILAIGVGLVFLFAPTRIGFTASLMSESIGDSLTALVIAGAIALLRVRDRRARAAVWIATGTCAIAWLLVRDTNVAIALAAAALAMIVCRGYRSRRAWAGCAAVFAVALAVVWTTGWEHARLPYQSDWDVRLTPRRMYPLVDNVMSRASSEVPPDLVALLPDRDQVWRVMTDSPDLRPLRDWILEHGSAAYARWLLRHPVDRIVELFDARWMLLGDVNASYMPGNWDRHGTMVDRLTRNHYVLAALCVVAPVLVWRPRGHRLRALALCLIASGLAGSIAAYFGDAAETSRHCYGAGQQALLGLFLALVARVDQLMVPTARRTRGSSG